MDCYSRGNINAPIMLIGEAPGKDEIRHEVEDVNMPIPFAGVSGRLLHKILKWTDITEGDFILTNVIKTGIFDETGKTRPPREDELMGESPNTKGGRPSLLLEINKIQPKLIIMLGKTPLWTLFFYDKMGYEDIRMTSYVGKLQYLDVKPNKIPCLPLFHPAAILRDEDNSRGFKAATTKALLEHKDLISSVVGRIML
jgi:DNA polymerase